MFQILHPQYFPPPKFDHYYDVIPLFHHSFNDFVQVIKIAFNKLHACCNGDFQSHFMLCFMYYCHIQQFTKIDTDPLQLHCSQPAEEIYTYNHSYTDHE